MAFSNNNFSALRELSGGSVFRSLPAATQAIIRNRAQQQQPTRRGSRPVSTVARTVAQPTPVRAVPVRTAKPGQQTPNPTGLQDLNTRPRSSGKPILPRPQAVPQNVPQIGVIGSEAALEEGLQGGLGILLASLEQARTDLAGAQRSAQRSLSSGRSQSGALTQDAVDRLQRFSGPGAEAFDLQSALSGALGPEAQAEAIANFEASPGQEFLQERSEQALLRNEAALGGLGGGRVREALAELGVGFGRQDFADQFNRLGALSAIGLGATGQQAGALGQQGANVSNLAGQGANIAQNIGQTSANLLGQLGQFGAGAFLGTGQNIAQGRTRAGEQIAGSQSGTAAALADLINQQGQGASSIVGQSTGSLANLLSGAGAQQGASQQQLASILANIGVGAGSQVAGLPGLPSLQRNPGILGGIGQAASGIGTAFGAFK